MGRVVYVTARLPFGDGEPFVTTEILALERRGMEVTVVPVRGSGDVVHADAARLRVVASRVYSGAVAGGSIVEALRSPFAALGALASLGRSRPSVLLKNIAVYPKGLWLARVARGAGASHIHAHWASTSSTMAMIAGRVSGIPWSMTAHRWDVAENNLLRLKSRNAFFVRAISKHGARELVGLVGDENWSPWILHMGVELPAAEGKDRGAVPLRVLTAARLVEKKGHVHLIEALRILRERGVEVRADLAGDGPLAERLATKAFQAGVNDRLTFLGVVSHDDLLAGLAAGRWNSAALPSVVTEKGELEGIPVSLVEAMAYGLPVVGTNAGGVPELLGDGAGILVPPADPEALADALQSLAEDTSLRARLGAAGRLRIEAEFSVELIAGELEARFRSSQSAAHRSA